MNDDIFYKDFFDKINLYYNQQKKIRRRKRKIVKTTLKVENRVFVRFFSKNTTFISRVINAKSTFSKRKSRKHFVISKILVIFKTLIFLRIIVNPSTKNTCYNCEKTEYYKNECL